MRVLSKSVASLFLLGGVSALAAPPIAPDFHAGKPLAVGGSGGWDYVTVDSANGRIYLPRSTHTMVVDEADGKVLGDIPGQSRNHGVALVPALHRGFITDGQKGEVVIFDLNTNEVLGSVKAADDADGIIFDAGTNKLFISCGDAQAVVPLSPDVDPKTGKADAAIDVGGKPEFLAADGAGRLFVSIEDKDNVAVIDTHSSKVLDHWAVAPGGAPVGMSIDVKAGQLFVGCRKPQKMIVMNTADGKIVADLPIGAGVDATAFDDGYAFASCRDGTLAVIGETSPGVFAVVATVPTAMGSRTLGVDSKTHRIFLPAADFNTPSAKGARPTLKEGSFHVLVIEPPAR